MSWILRKNDVNSIGKKLNNLKYSSKEVVNITFLISLQNFKAENVFLIKKFQSKTTLSDSQIVKFGKYIGKDLKKLVRFKLSVKGSDVPSDLKGKDIGKAIQNMEKEKYLSEQGLGSNKKVVGDDEYTFGPDWIPTSLGQRKKMKRIHKKINRSMRESLNEKYAIRGSKVEKFITGHNLKMKGRRYKEIEFETLKVDNSRKMITLRILAPKKLFGMEIPVKFATLRRGPFLKTDTKKKIKEIAVRPKPKKFKDIYNALPSDLKKRVYNLKNYDQRRDAHPEGNVLKHTIAVTNRALKTGDIDFGLAALFHDIGKDETAALHPKKGFWTHYGHEHVSAKLVKKYRKWIITMGGNPLDIYYMVKQHMRMKVFDKMKWTKQDKMKKFRSFDKLKKFSKFDRGGRK